MTLSSIKPVDTDSIDTGFFVNCIKKQLFINSFRYRSFENEEEGDEKFGCNLAVTKLTSGLVAVVSTF